MSDDLLHRRGARLLTWWGFDVYVAAFYIAPEARDSSEILGDTPRQLRLYYKRDISRADLIEATEQTLDKQDTIAIDGLEARFERWFTMYRDVRAGDSIVLTYIPGEGTQFDHNGSPVGVISGADFARAVFALWIGPDPISRDLRRALLGYES